jgi:hypothetical protein
MRSCNRLLSCEVTVQGECATTFDREPVVGDTIYGTVGDRRTAFRVIGVEHREDGPSIVRVALRPESVQIAPEPVEMPAEQIAEQLNRFAGKLQPLPEPRPAKPLKFLADYAHAIGSGPDPKTLPRRLRRMRTPRPWQIHSGR